MKRAFSLVELSLVLVILGLITGGILAGQSLIRGAEMRSLVSEMENYRSAVDIFRTKYEDLPGDMVNATTLWGEADGVPATCATTPSTGVETCDGDGDGLVLPTVTSHESYRFWQQLANAELIEGSYDGVSAIGANRYTSVAGQNSPKTKITGVTWFAYNWALYDGVGAGTNLFAIPSYGNIFYIGRENPLAYPNNNAFTPKEVWKIDSKIDDGKPARGNLVASNVIGCTDGTLATHLDSDYALTTTGELCRFLVVNAW